MPAQDAHAIVLKYGAQAAQQVGSAIVLDYAGVRTTTGVSASTRGVWGGSAKLELITRAPHPAAAEVPTRKTLAWGESQDQLTDLRAGWGLSTTIEVARRILWSTFGPLQRTLVRSEWLRGYTADLFRGLPWAGPLTTRDLEFGARWIQGAKADIEAEVPWGGFARHLDNDLRIIHGRSKAIDTLRWLPWVRYSTLLQTSIGVVIPVYDGTGPESLYVIPVQKVYYMQNNVTLTRVSDGLVIKSPSVSLALDADSWTWSFSANLAPWHLDDVVKQSGVPTILEVSVNGYAVRVIVEDITRERTFGSSSLRVSGRGISAMLAKPYAPDLISTNTEILTAQQIANNVLTLNGESIGWTVDWHLTDWSVPANVWNFQGVYADGLNAIAVAAGGYVQPHMTDQVVRFLKRYPYLPWDWSDVPPDYELPSDVVTVEGITDLSKPVYNRVYVSGQKDGVLVQATRTGTAGDVLAPMVTDSLITAQEAGRGRAEAVLADTGDQSTIRLRLPVLPDVGIILPGSFVRYTDNSTVKIGLSRAVQVEAAHEESWQTIEVETHA